jgi:membrane protein required for colicin V production
MNWLDIVIIVFLFLSIAGGLMTGFIKSIFGLVGLILGVVLAGRYYAPLADHLGFISNENAARVLAFIIILAAVGIVAGLLGIIFTRIVSTLTFGWLNRLLGAVFGLFQGSILIAALLIILVKYAGIGDFVSHSALASFLADKLPIVLGLLPSEFDSIKQFFQ